MLLPFGRINAELLNAEIEALCASLAVGTHFLSECNMGLTARQEIALVETVAYTFKAARIGGESVAA